MTAAEVALINPPPHQVEAIDNTRNGWEAIPCHPLGVKPSGNALVATSNLRDAIGTFNIFPDELILTCLEYLNSTSLLRLGCTCKALYAFTRSEDLWKAFLVR
jgi:hypothetical protein